MARNPKDINKKLRSLTKEQAVQLASALNSAYPDKKSAKKPAKKPATKSGK